MRRDDIVTVIRQTESFLHDCKVCIIHDVYEPVNCDAFMDRWCMKHGANCWSYRTNLVHKGCVLQYPDGKTRRFPKDEIE